VHTAQFSEDELCNQFGWYRKIKAGWFSVPSQDELLKPHSGKSGSVRGAQPIANTGRGSLSDEYQTNSSSQT
jgi:hypothetical protein